MSFSHICDDPQNSLTNGVTAHSHNFGLFVLGCSPATLAGKQPFAMHPVGHKAPQRKQEVEPHSATQAVERLRPRAATAIAQRFAHRVAAT